MANRSLNKVMLIGNLTRDPELRYTPSGVAVCTFGLATNRSWKDADGNVQEATEFHRTVAWGKLAEVCSQWLFKGRKAFVEGRLQTRDWTGQDGQKRTTTEVVIDSMLILDGRRQEERNIKPAEEVKVASPASTAGKSTTDEPAAPVKAEEPAKKAEEPIKKSKEPVKTQEEVKSEDIPF